MPTLLKNGCKSGTVIMLLDVDNVFSTAEVISIDNLSIEQVLNRWRKNKT
jgi:hypothetical protein